MSHILVVDDEPQITRILRAALRSSGHTVSIAANGLLAYELFEQDRPDLVITDLAMPEMNGLELTRSIRLRAKTPILVLSVRDSDSMKVAALDGGADDYLTKPFSIAELLARVRALLRRATPSEEDELSSERVEAGEFVIEPGPHRVSVRGRELHLSPKEFDLLLLLAREAGKVVPHRTLLRGVWGTAGEDQPDYLRVLVAQLRRKVDVPGEPSSIESEPWIGYRLRVTEAAATSTDS